MAELDRAFFRASDLSTKLNRLQGGNSYKALADDLEALASEFEHIYPQIHGKCATTPEDIKAATQMSTRLARIRGEEQLSPAAVAASRPRSTPCSPPLPSLAGAQGADLYVASWMKRQDGQTPITIVNVSHLDDEERTLVLGVLLEEFHSWVRTLPGAQRLRALLVFDEVYGFLPPHPANPPTKRPIVALTKQARGFGVGVVVVTQNPMDLDYRRARG